MNPFEERPVRRHPTGTEQARDRLDRSARAWRETRVRVAGWPADLAAAELAETARLFGAEPGTNPSVLQAEQMIASSPRTAERERGPASEATRIAAERLLAGTQSAEADAHGRLVSRRPT